MGKKELLEQVKALSENKSITKDELLEAYYQGLSAEEKPLRNAAISHVLYYIGGAIVFFGIVILIAQHWNALSFASRLLATLGASIVAYVCGGLFIKGGKGEHDVLGQAFFLISALLAPIGLWVLFNHFSLEFDDPAVHVLISGLLFLAFLISLFFFRKTIFEIYLFIFGTWLFFSTTSWIISNNNYLFNELNFYGYRFLVTGLTYILFGYWFAQRKEPISGPLYGFGSLFFLGAALALGRYYPDANLFWEIIYPGLIFGMIMLSVRLKSAALLVFSTIFLMAYIIKISAEYFRDSLGWPLSLIIAGLLIIAIGYYSVYINRKYIKQAEQNPK